MAPDEHTIYMLPSVVQIRLLRRRLQYYKILVRTFSKVSDFGPLASSLKCLDFRHMEKYAVVQYNTIYSTVGNVCLRMCVRVIITFILHYLDS